MCTCTVGQVLDMRQSAEVMVHADPESASMEELLCAIAERHNHPTKQNILANAQEGLSNADWVHFWEYTDRINPYLKIHADYVPISTVWCV